MALLISPCEQIDQLAADRIARDDHVKNRTAGLAYNLHFIELNARLCRRQWVRTKRYRPTEHEERRGRPHVAIRILDVRPNAVFQDRGNHRSVVIVCCFLRCRAHGDDRRLAGETRAQEDGKKTRQRRSRSLISLTQTASAVSGQPLRRPVRRALWQLVQVIELRARPCAAERRDVLEEGSAQD
jgi:hypothetical protein